MKEAQLRAIWGNPDEREKPLTELGHKSFDGEQMETLTEMFHARDSDYFDVLSCLSFNKDIITRQQRAGRLKQDTAYFDGYDQIKAKQFLQFILDRYEKDGFTELNRNKLPQLIQLNQLGTAKEAAEYFGGIEQLVAAYYGL
ncbi:MAG TPA: type I restriction-modification enzyme R subunit C-terminal domain-containing protein [Agriterribacter sp.]|nr:type I restriction-modification enzyme R subunit C-terminal domain-containing protein [Agriterribacter sp.]